MGNTPESFYNEERFWDSTASALASALGLERSAVDHLTWQKDMMLRSGFSVKEDWTTAWTPFFKRWRSQ